MICPITKKECIGDQCALHFQEVAEDGVTPVANMRGCSINMIAQYLMEIVGSRSCFDSKKSRKSQD